MGIESATLAEAKKDCCGCAACQYLCPTNAIHMKSDSEGFSYPSIDYDKCINCNKCNRLCAFKSDSKTLKYIKCENEPECYAVKHKSYEVRRNSRSGGIFTALSDYVIQNDGVVYGAITTSELCVTHFRAESATDRNLMRGSKYVQSDISNCFSLIKEDLDNHRKVLFTGTPCQIAAIKTALRKDYTNLYTVDIVCHGVPSPKVWKDYISYIQKKYHAECIEVDFRNKKKFGWPAHIETLKLKKGKRMKIINSRYYSELFYTHLILRPSCSVCPYKSTNHPGDITIADYWGIKKAAPEFFDQMGVSLVLVNGDKGKELFEYVKHELQYKKTELALSMQPPLQKSYPIPPNRDTFWDDYEKLGMEKTLLKYVGNQKDVNGKIMKQRISFLINSLLRR